MTQVRINLRSPVSGGSEGVRGLILFRPTERIVSDGAVVLPRPFAVHLKGESAIVDLTPTGADWCWEVREEVPSYMHMRHVIVPDSANVLDYATLAEASWAPSGDATTLAHSMRVTQSKLALGDVIAISEVKPSDNCSVGDTIVDVTGHVWMVTGLSDTMLTIGVDTGVSLRGEKGEQGLSFRTGRGIPTELTQGIVGDSYLDLETGDIYRLKL